MTRHASPPPTLPTRQRVSSLFSRSRTDSARRSRSSDRTRSPSPSPRSSHAQSYRHGTGRPVHPMRSASSRVGLARSESLSRQPFTASSRGTSKSTLSGRVSNSFRSVSKQSSTRSTQLSNRSKSASHDSKKSKSASHSSNKSKSASRHSDLVLLDESPTHTGHQGNPGRRLNFPRDGMNPYFAYGPNMWLPHLQLACRKPYFRGLAKLSGWRFITTEKGLANIVQLSESERSEDPGSLQNNVYGVVWLIPDEDMAKLDNSEHFPHIMGRTTRGNFPLRYLRGQEDIFYKGGEVQHPHGLTYAKFYYDRWRTTQGDSAMLGPEFHHAMNGAIDDICARYPDFIPYANEVLRRHVKPQSARGREDGQNAFLEQKPLRKRIIDARSEFFSDVKPRGSSFLRLNNFEIDPVHEPRTESVQLQESASQDRGSDWSGTRSRASKHGHSSHDSDSHPYGRALSRPSRSAHDSSPRSALRSRSGSADRRSYGSHGSRRSKPGSHSESYHRSAHGSRVRDSGYGSFMSDYDRYDTIGSRNRRSFDSSSRRSSSYLVSHESPRRASRHILHKPHSASRRSSRPSSRHRHPS